MELVIRITLPDGFGGMKGPQGADPDYGDESDQDKEERLARVYANGGTLNPQEFEFLRRRGGVRY